MKKTPLKIPHKNSIVVHVSYEKPPMQPPQKTIQKTHLKKSAVTNKSVKKSVPKNISKPKAPPPPIKKKKSSVKRKDSPTPRPLKKKIIYRKKPVSKQVKAIKELKKTLEKMESLHGAPKTPPLSKTSIDTASNKETLPKTSFSKATKTIPNKNLSIDSNEPIEQKYLDKLISHLKIALELPEYGKVKLKLTLTHKGKVEELQVLHSESKKNKDYLLENLHLVTFPPFLEEFKNKEKHVFVFTFCNDI